MPCGTRRRSNIIETHTDPHGLRNEANSKFPSSITSPGDLGLLWNTETRTSFANLTCDNLSIVDWL